MIDIICLLAIPVIIVGMFALASVQAAGKPTPKPPKRERGND